MGFQICDLRSSGSDFEFSGEGMDVDGPGLMDRGGEMALSE